MPEPEPESQELALAGASELVEPKRTYVLPHQPAEALELLRSGGGPRVLQEVEVSSARGIEPFIVLRPGGFTIYKPWRPAIPNHSSALSGDVAVGPAVSGELLETPRGCQLELSVRPYAPTPAQLPTVMVAVVAWAVFVLAPIILAGLNPVAFALSAVSFFGGIFSVLAYDRRRRERDIRDLLAVVERTYGPHELSALSGLPHRELGSG